ncbi:hypothetical protein [Streptosporangium sp. NPDC048865]|uniref:hypothetical protein n=1 Tax=Streptosporangium sp. NPDC048865 TaxID=3155766 RepID=UPI0034470A6E
MESEWDVDRALAITAYAGSKHGEKLIAAIRYLNEKHGARDADNFDLRCRTCRDSRGRPAPWPCSTRVDLGKILGVPVGPEHIEMFRDVGRLINQTPRRQTPVTRASRKEIAPR